MFALRLDRQRQIFRGNVLHAQVAVNHSVGFLILGILQLVPANDGILVAKPDAFAQVAEALVYRFVLDEVDEGAMVQIALYGCSNDSIYFCSAEVLSAWGFLLISLKRS